MLVPFEVKENGFGNFSAGVMFICLEFLLFVITYRVSSNHNQSKCRSKHGHESGLQFREQELSEKMDIVSDVSA